jgi:hypothetical protein
MKSKDEITIHVDGTTAYFSGVKAAVLVSTDSRNIFYNKEKKTTTITVKGVKDPPPLVPWGDLNKLPQEIIEKVYMLPQMTSNMWFNIVSSYGDGVKPVKITYNEKGEKVIAPYTDNAEVKLFFEENDTDLYLLEQFTDLHWFFNCFPEVVFNKQKGDQRKIVEISSKEAAFSRWSEMSKNAPYRIDYHYYFAYWGEKQPDKQDYPCIATKVLDHKNPIRHLRQIMDETKDKEFTDWDTRYIVPVTFPTPGRNYYQQPYWYSLILSGWYDFAIKIPAFKDTLLKNIAFLNYIVELAPGYFEEIFKREKISDDKLQQTRIKKEYADINTFLKGTEATGKSIITFQKKDPQGQPYPMIVIKVIKNEMKGGEYIEDSEEVSNIIAYGMLVQPSLVGPPPGKNSPINGTEARELFIIKQALLKPFRDRILRPFYLIKAINKWPDDLHFVIPNLELTTLDKEKTGSVTKIPKQP